MNEKRITQRQKIKELFLRNPNTWVSLKEIIFLGIAMYPPRIKELRTSKNEGGEGMNIENRLEVVDGIKHSYYRYNKPLSYVHQDILPYARNKY